MCEMWLAALAGLRCDPCLLAIEAAGKRPEPVTSFGPDVSFLIIKLEGLSRNCFKWAADRGVVGVLGRLSTRVVPLLGVPNVLKLSLPLKVMVTAGRKDQ